MDCGGTPEEAAALNKKMTDACESEGRDPATLVRTVSPGINLLASVDAFNDGVAEYHAAGIRDICMPWPRVPAEVPVLREVAASALPQFRGHPANTSDSDGAAQHIEAISAGALQAVLAGMVNCK